MVTFAPRFGPVVVKSVIDIRLVPDQKWIGRAGRLIALQDMQELRNEQVLYRAALALVMQLDRASHNHVAMQQLKFAIDAQLTKELNQQERRKKHDFALRSVRTQSAETFSTFNVSVSNSVVQNVHNIIAIGFTGQGSKLRKKELLKREKTKKLLAGRKQTIARMNQ